MGASKRVKAVSVVLEDGTMIVHQLDPDKNNAFYRQGDTVEMQGYKVIDRKYTHEVHWTEPAEILQG